MAYTKFDQYISQFIPSQFPLTYQERAPNFITFVEAYFEWLQSTGNPVAVQRALPTYFDVDTTPQAFLLHFMNEYLNAIPQNMMANPRLVIKHILNLYRTKGTQRAYELLFRMMFNEDINIFIPGQYLFKPSDNQWIKTRYIEVTDSPFLNDIIGFEITSSSGGGTALVESIVKKIVNNKVINIVILSNLIGDFKYGEQIFCSQVPQLSNNAPVIQGSLSNIVVTDGGENWNVGDMLTVEGSGTDAIAKVKSVLTTLSGTVDFNLINGGGLYSMNPQITVSGGGGTDASFTVGGLSNTQNIQVDTDIINTYEAVPMENSVSGFMLSLTGTSGTYNVGDYVTASANINILDVSYQSGNVQQFESLSNTSLNISGLNVVRSDGSYISITGLDSNLLNANLVAGAVLVSNTSASVIQILNTLGLQTISGTGNVSSITGSNVSVTNTTGYFLPTANCVDSNGGAFGTISQTYRETNWGFPAIANSNLDTPLNQMLSYENLLVGKIAFLTNINPGENYTSPPIVSVFEPSTYALQLMDSSGNFLGNDAVITTTLDYSVNSAASLLVDQSGFGYEPNELLTLTNANNTTEIMGEALVETSGVMSGYYLNKNSFLSDVMKIQDSNYYQIFSYEIQTNQMFDAYEDLVNSIVHPVGIALFGRYVRTDLQNAEPVVNSFSITQSGF